MTASTPADCDRAIQVQPAYRLLRRALNWDCGRGLLRLVRDDPHPVALLGAWAGSGAVIGSEPALVRSPPQDLGDVLEALIPDWAALLSAAAGSAPRLRARRDLLPQPPAPGGPRRLPDWWFGYYDHVLRWEETSAQWFFEALWTPGRSAELERRFDEL